MWCVLNEILNELYMKSYQLYNNNNKNKNNNNKISINTYLVVLSLFNQ